MSSSHKRKRQHGLASEESDIHLVNGTRCEDLAETCTGTDENFSQRGSKHPRHEEKDFKTSLNSQNQAINVLAPLPLISSHLKIAHGGSHWHARQSFQNLVVFGDSYSKSYEGDTWVDHLQRRIRTSNSPELLNFAFPGATAEDDLSDQLSSFSRTYVNEEKTDRSRALDPDRTIYFIFLGINDCGSTEEDELESVVEKIFDALHTLYVKAGARNFVLFDIPPINRSPQATNLKSEEVMEERVQAWNELLQTQANEFALSSEKATMLLFSTHQALTDVLEDPLEYDFSEDDPSDECGSIWADDLHLTSEVHDIIAERLLKSVLGSSS